MWGEKDQQSVITKYKIVAGLHALLGIGLLACAIMGTLSAQEYDGYIGPPFYTGGYFVGILNVFGAILATFVVLRDAAGNKQTTRAKTTQVGCAMRVHQIVAMLSIMMCLVGLFLAGSFVTNNEGGDGSSHDDHDDMSEIRDRNRILSCAIIAGCVASILLTMFVIYIFCTHGSDFGVKNHRGRIVALNTVYPNIPGITTSSTYPAQTNSSPQMEQLHAQNVILQQQISLQQQQLQQQQQGVSGGPNIPPPPSYSAVMTDPRHPPPNDAMPSAQAPFKS